MTLDTKVFLQRTLWTGGGSLISQASFPSLPLSWCVNLQSQANTDVSGYSVAIIRLYDFRKASFSWHPKKKRTSPGLLTHPTNKKFFWIFLTHRDEDFLHAAFRGYDKNKDGKISLEEFQRVMTRRWGWERWSRFLIETNSHLQQHVEETDREYDDEGRLEWRRVSEFLSICQSVFFQVCWLWRICEDDASIKSENICWTRFS